MAKITRRKHATRFVALAAASFPLVATAHEHNHQHHHNKVFQLPTIHVQAEQEGYKINRSGSKKYSEELLNTPKTVQIIDRKLLQDQGAASLAEALKNVPGITMQLGENGRTSAGDTFQMRGFSSQNATFVDGIRDVGAVSRDVFNLEQVEVIKGVAGSETGRGANAGYVNLLTKLPHVNNEHQVSLIWNTANHKRATVDLNQSFNDSTAARLNAMAQDGKVAGRDFVKNKGYAVAPSIAFGLGSDTRFYLYSQHLHQNNIPDGAIPTIGMKGYYSDRKENNGYHDALMQGKKVNRKNFYGSATDYEKIDANMVTAKIEADLTDNLQLTNLTRWGNNHMKRDLTGVLFINANQSTNPEEWTVGRSRQGVDQENKILGNQSLLNWDFTTGTVRHDAVIGLEVLREQQISRGLSTAGQSAISANLYRPNLYDEQPKLTYNGANTTGQTETAALFLFDTLKFGDKVYINGGIRTDYYDTRYFGFVLPRGKTQLENVNLKTDGHLISWNAGALFKPTENSSIYANYAKSLTPPGSSNFSLNETGNNSDAAKPEETHHYEIGAKWDILDEQLALNLAAYRTENDNQFTIDKISQESVQEASTRVEGIEFSAVGNITNDWNISAAVAHMKTKPINQQNSRGKTTAIRWSPEWTASLWSTYQLNGFKVGLGARYVGEQKRLNNDQTVPSATNMPEIPSYVVFDALLGYQFNKHADVNLNIYNLADKEYIQSLNNSGARAILGQPRSAALTFNYKF